MEFENLNSDAIASSVGRKQINYSKGDPHSVANTSVETSRLFLPSYNITVLCTLVQNTNR